MNTQPNTIKKDGGASAPRTTSHSLVMHARRRLELTGILDILRFDDTFAELSTDMGDLIIDGKQLRIEAFDTDRGTVLLTGEIDACSYFSKNDGNMQKRNGLFSKKR